jgi:hypothetical protein
VTIGGANQLFMASSATLSEAASDDREGARARRPALAALTIALITVSTAAAGALATDPELGLVRSA